MVFASVKISLTETGALITVPVVMARVPLHTAIAGAGTALSDDQVVEVVQGACPAEAYQGKRVLLLVPDNTRAAPVGQMFKALYRQLAPVTDSFDLLIALGSHPAMSEEAICQRLDISRSERQEVYRQVRFFNHAWKDPTALKPVGVISSTTVGQLTDGWFSMDVPVAVNKRIFDYDQVIIVGPVTPHEVAGFSGGNKYLFPGISGADILDFFHWLGAVVTNPRIIGHKWTPVRKVIDRAAALVKMPKLCFCLVVRPDTSLSGLFAGSPEEAWEAAADLSEREHIVLKDRSFDTIVACAPLMYDELWTAGKCMYKLEPVLARGGELIIYAPHLNTVSKTHGDHIREIGYHCRDYFQKQWDRFKNRPWSVLAHCTLVRGGGTFEDGVEECRAQVILASQIPEQVCHQLNLGYRDPASINIEDHAHRENEGILLVRQAGETLYRLR